MPNEPTNQEVATLIDISEAQVQHFRGESYLLGDGTWLVHFAYFMPKELRAKLTGSFTLMIKPHACAGERRSG